MTTLYGRIIQKVLKNEALPSGREGYYFALAHDLHWWEVLDRLAIALKTRDLVADSKIQVWPGDETAAEVMGVPVEFVQPFWNANAG